MSNTPGYRFPLARRRRWPLYAGIVFFLGLPAALLLGGALGSDAALLAAGGIVAALLLPFALFLGWALWRPVLVISDEGVFLRGPTGSGEVSVAWEQVESLRLDAGAEGLVLRAPVESKFTTRLRNWAGVRINGAPITAARNLQDIAERRFIPLDGFAAWFEEGKLREAFATHAPHLLTDFETQRHSALASNRQGRIVLVWVVGLCLVYVAVVVSFALIDFEFSPGWAVAGRWLWKFLFLVVAVGMATVVWGNLHSVRHYLAERQWGMAFFWLVAGLVQAAIGLLALVEALR
ncbi:MAG: hypothetical protein HYZ17_05705 [Betaproteobacteria bacterium]|nr:hypothetical protein [Betaproteobacteria bacterium]